MGQCNSTEEEANLHKLKIDNSKEGMTFGLAAMRGWRKFMQDTHICMIDFNNDPELSLFAVFDGHAGSQVAIFVRDQFPNQLKKNPQFQYGNYGQALRQTFIKMDQMLLSDYGVRKLQQIIEQQCNKHNAKNVCGQSKAGCTALVCLVTPCMIFVANAGDSRGIAYTNNSCIQINTQHKPKVQSESTRIIQAGGQIIYDRVMGDINITRCIGDFQYKKNSNIQRHKQMIICDPEIMQIERDSCDYFMIGSDGIWESKDNLAMHNWLTDIPADMKISHKLSLLLDQEVAKVKDTEYGKDNMTAIMVKFR